MLRRSSLGAAVLFPWDCSEGVLVIFGEGETQAFQAESINDCFCKIKVDQIATMGFVDSG